MVIVYMTRLGIRIPFYRWQWNLNNLSENEKIEFLKDLKHKDEQKYYKFKNWQKEHFKRKDYKKIVEKLTTIEKTAYELYLNNQLKESYECYYSIMEDTIDFKKKDWIESFRWYDEILLNCLFNFSGDYQSFFTNLFRITDDNYQIWYDKAKFFADNYLSVNAVECCRKLLKFNPNDVNVLKIIAKELYKLKQFSESLIYCDEVLKIENDEYIISNKIFSLIKLNRTPEAYEYYMNLSDKTGSLSYSHYLMNELERIKRFDYFIDYHYTSFNECPTGYYHIDEIKRIFNIYDVNEEPKYPKHYYMHWIDSIKHLNEFKPCPHCGNELLKVVFVFDDNKNLNKIIGDKIFLPYSYPHSHNHILGYCSYCDKSFDFGFYSIKIECDDETLKGFIKHKLNEFIDHMVEFEVDGQVSLKKLFDHCEEFDEIEFNKFIDKLKSINLIFETEKGFIKLNGFIELYWDLFFTW